MGYFKDLIVTGVTRLLSKLYVNDSVIAPKFIGDLQGNADSASKLATARNIAITGSVTGNANFDGSGNISISTNTNHSHNYAGSNSAGGAANSALSLEGFFRNGGVSWGFLSGPNYTCIAAFDTSNGGGMAFADKGGQTSFQIDGLFYQDEGRYMCLDVNNYGQYCAPANHSHRVSYGTSVPSSLADGQLYCVIES